jgi:hypothetical protein
MSYYPNKPNRKSIRLKDYDYARISTYIKNNPAKWDEDGLNNEGKV